MANENPCFSAISPAGTVSPGRASFWRVWAVAALLVVIAGLAYSNTFRVPFIFDDLWSIPYNETIREIGTSFSPPNTNGETVSGRPLVNFTFAVNYAISYTRVWSYHLGNLLIHVCAGLVLFGLMRCTLLLPRLRVVCGGWFARWSLSVAWVVAALWMMHPMQTESVTYMVQRAESLMALFYLLTLYCFVRGAGNEFSILDAGISGSVVSKVGGGTSKVGNHRGLLWLAVSVVCCLFGMASKEVMVSAPLMVLFFDRAFVAGSFYAALRRRYVYYLLLAGTWILMIALAVHTGNRGVTAGLGVGMPVWTYVLTQMQAIPHYLRLALWPRGLVFDYGTATVTSFADVWPQCVLLIGLAGATVWACVRKPMIGFLGLLVFAVLAPTSSFIPVATQTIATHRMYLPLAAVAALVVTGVFYGAWKYRWNQILMCGVLVLVALGLAGLTYQRNMVYQSNLTLWQDTLDKLPDKDRARSHNNLANALIDEGRLQEAIDHCVEALRLKSDFPQAYNNQGYALSKMGRYNDALWYYDKALSFGQAGMDVTLNNRGYALYNLGRFEDAISDYKASLKLRPAYAEARSNYSNVLCALQRYDEALEQLDEALRSEPDFAAAWNNRGNVYAARGQNPDEAMRCYKKAVELDPKMELAVDNVARYSLVLGRAAEALPYFEMQAKLAPEKAIVEQGWGNALMMLKRQAEAISHFQRALKLDPGLFGSRHNLAIALQNAGRVSEALVEYEKALAMQPAMAPLRHNYAGALDAAGRLDEAIAEEREALHLDPGFAYAQEQLDALLAKKNQQLGGK